MNRVTQNRVPLTSSTCHVTAPVYLQQFNPQTLFQLDHNTSPRQSPYHRSLQSHTQTLNKYDYYYAYVFSYLLLLLLVVSMCLFVCLLVFFVFCLEGDAAQEFKALAAQGLFREETPKGH